MSLRNRSLVVKPQPQLEIVPKFSFGKTFGPFGLNKILSAVPVVLLLLFYLAYLSKNKKNKNKQQTDQRKKAVEQPDSMDWRLLGAVTPVQSKRRCGACWAFATAATVESIHKIVSGDLIQLSAQQLIDCDLSCSGCSGCRRWGNIAFDYVMRMGIARDIDYPFTGVEGKCDGKKLRDARIVTIDGGSDVLNLVMRRL